MKQLIECSTCGYPLTPEEREGLVEIDGKMCKPREWKSLTDEESKAAPALTVRRVDGDWLVSHGGQEVNFGTSVTISFDDLGIVTISFDDLGIVRCDSQEKVVVKPPAAPQREWVGLTEDDIDWIKGSANRAIGYIRVTAAKLKEKNT